MNPENDIPRRLGDRYEVGEVLGRGGMAEVHLSRDSRLGRLVAVKMLRSDLARDPVFQARFRREAHSAAALNHPSVVAVYDTGEDSFAEPGGVAARVPYIVMEYVEGRTGKELLQAADGIGGAGADGAGAGLGTERAAEVTAGVLTALDYSHRQGIIHRDIKPANVMVTPDGQVKVMDFGIARALADTSATMTQTHAVIGTAQYLSPEQARGEQVDARTDLYSTGCLLYELLTGRPPFVGDSPVSVAYQHVREVPVPPSRLNPAVSDALDRVVLKALAKDRDDRYANAEEFRRDLLAAAGGRPVGAPAVGAAAAMATQALPSGAEATRALTAAGYGSQDTAATTRHQPQADRTSVDGFGALAGAEAGAGYARAGATGVRTRTSEQEDERPKRRGLAVFGVVLAVLVALGLLGVVLYNLLGENQPPPPAQVAVPTLVDGTDAEARQLLADAELGFVEERTEDDAEPGTVIDQDPDAGTQVDVGSDVTVTVSNGPSPVAVPDVTGQSESAALRNLTAADLEVGETVREPSPDVPEDQVIRTDPERGTEVPPGTTVTLVVSSGTSVLEDLTGRNVFEAQAALIRAGFEPAVVEEANGDVAPDTVIRQDPPPGEVEPGTTVTLVVATAPEPAPEPTETPEEEEDGESPSPSSSPSSGSSSSSSRSS